MKVKRERNLYLRRVFTQDPHTYSYDMSNGKYSLINKEGSELAVSSNGILRPKFRPNISGCASHKQREKECIKDPAALHFTPDARPSGKYLNLMPRKFGGYAQQPYQLQQSPSFLKQVKTNMFTVPSPRRRHYLTQQSEVNHSERNIILSESFTKYKDQSFFKRAWGSIAGTSPRPIDKKKSCYNNKCKFLKQLVFEELISQKESKVKSTPIYRQTLGKSFHDERLQSEDEEWRRLAKMGLNTLRK